MNKKQKNNKKNAFTLVETVVTIVTLGIVTVMAAPHIFHKFSGSHRLIKVKKAMSTYESVMRRINIENRIKTNDALLTWAPLDDCTNTSKYFNSVTILDDDNGTNCLFKTHDGLFWDISNIQKVIIAFKESDLNTANADIDNNKAFYMMSVFDENGILRVNDISYLNNADQKKLANLYKFLGRNIDNINFDTCEDSYCNFSKGVYDEMCTEDKDTSCRACKSNACDYYNEEGLMIAQKTSCNSTFEDCKITMTYHPDGKPKSIKTPLYEIDKILYGGDEICDPIMSGTYVTGTNNESCYNSAQCNKTVCNFFNEKGERLMKIFSCNSLSNNLVDMRTCKNINIYKADGQTTIATMTKCNHSTGVCTCKGSGCP